MRGVEHGRVGTVGQEVILLTGGGGVEEFCEAQDALSPRSPPRVGSTSSRDRRISVVSSSLPPLILLLLSPLPLPLLPLLPSPSPSPSLSPSPLPSPRRCYCCTSSTLGSSGKTPLWEDKSPRKVSSSLPLSLLPL